MKNRQFESEIEARLLEIFNAYFQGEDVAPATLFRTEGFIEAGCCIGLTTEKQVVELMEELYRQVFNSEFPEVISGRVQIPSVMRRAPVYTTCN